MQIKKGGMLFQIAFMFTGYEEDPPRVGRCNLVWRFLFCLVPWVVLSATYWIVFGLALGIIGQVALRIYRFLIDAAQPVFSDGVDRRSWLWVPGRNALIRLNAMNYRQYRRIEWLGFLSDDRGANTLPPLMAIFLFVVCIGLLFLIFYAVPFYYVPIFWHSMGAPAFNFLYDTMTWWLWLVAGLTVAALLWWLGIRFTKSEIGSVLIGHFKEWKEKHCPMYDVV